MVSKGFLNVTTSSQQYNMGENPSVILYTIINFHARTPKPQSRNTVSLGVQNGSGLYSNMVLEKGKIIVKLNLINVSIY